MEKMTREQTQEFHAKMFDLGQPLMQEISNELNKLKPAIDFFEDCNIQIQFDDKDDFIQSAIYEPSAQLVEFGEGMDLLVSASKITALLAQFADKVAKPASDNYPFLYMEAEQ